MKNESWFPLGIPWKQERDVYKRQSFYGTLGVTPAA